MKQEKGCEKNESFFTALFFDVGSLHKDLINSLFTLNFFHYLSISPQMLANPVFTDFF